MLNVFKNLLRGYNIVSHRGEHMNKSNKHFIYSVYALGGGAFISLTTFLIDNLDILDVKYKPQLGVHSCWLQSMYA